MGDPPRFSILGPLRVEPGVALPRSPVLRGLLGALLAARDEPLPADRLMRLVWSGPVAAGSLHVGLSRLRRWLDALAFPAVIEYDPGGYRLALPTGAVDLDGFRELTARSRSAGDPAERATAAGAAMRLCRGPLLADVTLEGDDPMLRRIRAELREACLAASEAALAVGRPDEAVGWLSEFVDREPFDEPAHALLITALAADDRPADALGRYDRLRRALADELGVHPGSAVQAAYLAVLAADGPSEAETVRARPGLLPADIAEFTGREKQLAEILGRLADGSNPTVMPVLGVTGQPGVGKTALAVRAAHLLRPSFPDGQLFVDLHGLGPRPADPAEVLGRLLRALGVDGGSVPDGLDERAERYRAELDGRRVLVVLDNAADEAQVRPLLPGSPTCAALVTSRRPLTGLSGPTIRLEVMDLPTTIDLLSAFVGRDRLVAEPSAADDIAVLCGGLPLAVRIAGGRLARLPHRPLSWLAERLADDRRRLDEFRLEDLEVRASLGWSYRALPPPAARLLGRLAALDATPVSGWVAGALLDLDPDEAEEHLDALVDAHLVEIAGSSRYALHDLVRAYGRERAAQDDDPTELTAALHRALAGWLARAQAAADALGHRLIGADPGPVGVVVADPGGWFDTERAALVASVRQAHALGADRLCWELACHLSGYFELRNLHDDWHDTHRIALAAAERSGDDRGAGLIRHALGELYANRDDYEQALAQLNRAAELLAGHGDRLAEANVLRSLGVAQRMTGDIDGARSSLESALSVFVEHRDEAGVAHVQHGLGAIHREQGRLDEAAKSYRDSLVYFEAIDDPFTASLYRCSLGVVLRLLGRLPEAEECFRRSLELCRTIGNPPGKAYALGYLGDLKTDQGEYGVARTMLDASRSLAARLGDQFAVALADRGLGRLLAATGDREAARAAYVSALNILTEDMPLWRGRTLEAIGDLDADPAAWAAALELYRRVDAPEAAALEAKLNR